MTNATETNELLDGIENIVTHHWPSDTTATGGSIRKAWLAMAADGLGAIGKDPDLGGLGVAAATASLLGGLPCPVPFIDSYCANRLRAIAGDSASGDGLIAFAWPLGATPAFSDGHLRGTASHIEDPADADGFMVVTDGGVALVERNAVGIEHRLIEGLARPALADLRFKETPARLIALDGATRDALFRVARLLHAARAAGAARRGFALVTEHVRSRRQFGRPLAQFQAMQLKLADIMIALDASERMIATAAAREEQGDPDWSYLAEAAIAFTAHRVREAFFEIQHAFGAVGYADVHELTRLFRLFHLDIVRMASQRHARDQLAAHLIDRGGDLPLHDLGTEPGEIRQAVREWLETNWTASHAETERAKPFHQRGRNADFAEALGRSGWLTAGWPVECGGRGLRPFSQLAIVQELSRTEAPVSSCVASAWIVGPEIVRHGSESLKAEVLPAIREGRARFSLGYSEPEAGSDLASLKTRAVRDGDDYVVTGQKLWGTGADTATHIVLAVRTAPEAKPANAGISVLLVDTTLPGISIRPEAALYGHTFCTQFFDEVRVPVRMRIGPENGGWAILTGALAAERIQMGGNIVRLEAAFAALCAYVAADQARRSDAHIRDQIGMLAAEIEAARQLSVASVQILESGTVPRVEGSVTKVFSGALAERFATVAMDIVGPASLDGEGEQDAPMGGQLEWLLRQSIMLVIGGGAAEIQKGIIARHGIGL